MTPSEVRHIQKVVQDVVALFRRDALPQGWYGVKGLSRATGVPRHKIYEWMVGKTVPSPMYTVRFVPVVNYIGWLVEPGREAIGLEDLRPDIWGDWQRVLEAAQPYIDEVPVDEIKQNAKEALAG